MIDQAVVVGPVGIERHVLVSALFASDTVGHAVAKSLLRQTEGLGGSGYFAAAALIARGVHVHLATNTGAGSALGERLASALSLDSMHDEAVGRTSEYLSIWDPEDRKQLYVRSGEDPVDAGITLATAHPEVPVVVLSLRDTSSYERLTNMKGASNRLFVAPNQTLLSSEATFATIAQRAAVVVLNEREAFEAARATSMEMVEQWFRSLGPDATLVVTHGGTHLTVLGAESGSRTVKLVASHNRSFVLGGGDAFVAFAAVQWTTTRADFGLLAAAEATDQHLQAQSLFDEE